MRIGRGPKDDLVLRHRRGLEPDKGLLLELYELLDQVLQHLPLSVGPPDDGPFGSVNGSAARPMSIDMFPALTIK